MGYSTHDLCALRARPLSSEKSYQEAITEGERASNGVAYRFNLLQKGWFGSYECRVHRSLLNIPSKRIATEEFEVYGHRWYVSIEHTKEGHLATHLHSKNRSAVNLVYCITVLNQSGRERHIRSGGNALFQPDGTVGRSGQVLISKISDPEAGFLLSESFVVRIDFRLVLPENDKHTFFVDTRSGKFTWELNDLMERSPQMMTSPVFTAADHKWQLLIYPHGEERGASHAGVYLHCVSDFSGSVRAKRKVTVLNHHSERMTVSNEDVLTFRKGSAWGRRDFIEIKRLKDEGLGFVKDGWTTITAYVEVLKDEQTMKTRPQGLSLQQPSPDEDWLCVYCLDKKQTAGVVHGRTMHKCVCSDCVKILEREKLPCPICRRKVDLYISQIF